MTLPQVAMQYASSGGSGLVFEIQQGMVGEMQQDSLPLCHLSPQPWPYSQAQTLLSSVFLNLFSVSHLLSPEPRPSPSIKPDFESPS